MPPSRPARKRGSYVHTLRRVLREARDASRDCALPESELPIIQAPMAGSQGSALAIAVSNAGGLGSLPCAMLAPDAMRDELLAITRRPRSRTTSTSSCTAAAARRRARGRVAQTAGAVLRTSSASIPAAIHAGPGAHAVQRRGGGCARGVQAAGRELSFRPAVGRLARARQAAGARRFCRRRRRSTKRDGSKRAASTPSSRRASRPAVIAASSCPTTSARRSARSRSCRRSSTAVQRAGDRRRRHRRRQRRGGGAGARRRGRAGRHGLSALSRSDHQRRASRGAQERRGARHGADECVHRPAGARHRQPPDARARSDQRRGAARFRWPPRRSRRCAPRPKRRAAATSRRCGPVRMRMGAPNSRRRS